MAGIHVEKRIVSGPYEAIVHVEAPRYSLALSDEVISALGAMVVGVRSIGVRQATPAVPGFDECDIELADGGIVRLFAQSEHLEPRFEVFPIGASLKAEAKLEPRHELVLSGPVDIALLRTEEWLDPTLPCGETVGSNPIMQCQGRPGSAPEEATMVCSYVAGVVLRGADGSGLLIATLAFPTLIYVSGIAGGGSVPQGVFIPERLHVA